MKWYQQMLYNIFIGARRRMEKYIQQIIKYKAERMNFYEWKRKNIYFWCRLRELPFAVCDAEATMAEKMI